MATRNITFNLPEDLIRRAKVYAAQHDTSVNAVVRRLLEDSIPDEDRAYEAGQQHLAIEKRGSHSDVDPGTIRREDL